MVHLKDTLIEVDYKKKSRNELVEVQSQQIESLKKINNSIVELDVNICYFEDIVQLSMRNFKKKLIMVLP